MVILCKSAHDGAENVPFLSWISSCDCFGGKTCIYIAALTISHWTCYAPITRTLCYQHPCDKTKDSNRNHFAEEWGSSKISV